MSTRSEISCWADVSAGYRADVAQVKRSRPVDLGRPVGPSFSGRPFLRTRDVAVSQAMRILIVENEPVLIVLLSRRVPCVPKRRYSAEHGRGFSLRPLAVSAVLTYMQGEST